MTTDTDRAVSDEEKVAMILQEIECYVTVSKMVRLGKKSEDGKHRPIKVTLSDAESRSSVLQNAKKLKESSDGFKVIYVKKDLSPHSLKEMARLRKVLQREREKPENIGKNITMDYRKRQVLVNDVVIDKQHPHPFQKSGSS